MKKVVFAAIASIFAAASIAFTPIAAQATYAADAANCSSNQMKINVEVNATNGMTVALSANMSAKGAFTASWGDGTNSLFSNSLSIANSLAASNKYAVAGQYTITIATVNGSLMNAYGSYSSFGKAPIQAVTCWGSALGLTSLANAFYGNVNLTSVPSQLPSSGIQNLSGAFQGATKFNSANIGNWDVSQVVDFSNMFYEASTFNQDIQGWRTGSAKNMNQMFFRAAAFNKPINTNGIFWDVSKASFTGMFSQAKAFNQPLNYWNTGSCTDFTETFTWATSFNQDLSNWNTSNATKMDSMFASATAFNNGATGNFGGKPLTANGTKWDVSKVTTMQNMFVLASAFNQDVSSWATSSLTNLWGAFSFATKFNQNISNWDVSKVKTFRAMFYGANFNNLGQPLNWTTGTTFPIEAPSMFQQNYAFNVPFGPGWNTASFTDMTYMFKSAGIFNQDISNWNTGEVTKFKGMFSVAYAFNSDISGWNTTKAVDLKDMFLGAKVFNRDLSSWDLPAARDLSGFLSWSGMSKINYGKFLLSLGARTLSATPIAAQDPKQIFNNSMTLGAVTLIAPCDSLDAAVVGAQDKRELLITAGWVIKDETPDVCSVSTTPTTVTVAVSPTSGSHVYGDEPQLITYAASVPDGDSLTAPIVCEARVTSGGAALTLSTSVASNYVTLCSSATATTALGNTLDFSKIGTYKVTAAPLTIAAKSLNKVYGTAVALSGSNGFTANGLKNADAVASATLVSTSGVLRTATVAGGPYSIDISGAVFSTGSSSNYIISYVHGAITVTKAPLKVTAVDKKTTVGTSVTFNNGLASSGLLSRFYDYANGSFDAAEGAGTLAETAVPKPERVRNAFDITNSAKKSIRCGDVIGNLNIQYLTSGALTQGTCTGSSTTDSGGTYTGIASILVYSTGYLTPSQTAEYTFCTSSDDGSYLKLDNLELIDDWKAHGAVEPCNKTSLPITLNAGQSYAFDYWGFQGGRDMLFQVKWKKSTDANYTVISVDNFSNSLTDFTADGLVNGEALTGATLDSSGKGATTSGVFSIPVTNATAAAGVLDNYEVEYISGELTVGIQTPPVNPPATIVARGQRMVYGSTPIVVTNQFDASGTATGVVTCKVYRELDSDGNYIHEMTSSDYKVGMYIIHCSSTSGNDRFIDATYTVTPKLVNISLTGITKTYGNTLTSSDMTVTYRESDLEAGDKISGFNSGSFANTLTSAERGVVNSTNRGEDVLSVKTVSNHGLKAGDVAQITVLNAGIGISSGVYRVATVIDDKTFTVLGEFVSASVTVSAGSDIQVARETGFEATADVGSYTIQISPGTPCSGGIFGVNLENYQFVCSSATLTVLPRTIVIAPNSATVEVGQTFNGEISYEVQSFVNDETAEIAKNYVAPKCISGYTTAAQPSATFAIQCSGAAATNYNFTYQGASIRTGVAQSGGSTPPPVALSTATPPTVSLTGGNINVTVGTYTTPVIKFTLIVSVNGQQVQIAELGSSEANYNVEVNPAWAGKTVKIEIKATNSSGISITSVKSLKIPTYFKNIVVVSGQNGNSSIVKYVVLSFTANSAKLSASQLASLVAAGISSGQQVKITGHVFKWSTQAWQQKISLDRALAVRNQLKSKMKANVVSALGYGATANRLCAKLLNRCVVVEVKKVN